MDPLAAQGGQDMLSPYQAMGDNPVSGTDPGGTMPPGGPVGFRNPNIVPFFSPAGGGIGSPTNETYIPGINPADFSVGQWITTFGGAAEGMEEAFGQSAGYDYSATVGNNSGTSSQTAGNYSNHNAGGDPPSEVGKGDSKSSTSDGTDASAIAVGGATGSFVSELTTGIEVTVDVTGAAIASGFATVALVFLPINTAAPSMEMRNIDPYGDPKNWKTEIPDKTNRIRPVYFNNKNYFPGGNGNDFIKWFVRFGAMGVTYKKFWYDPSHPDKH